MEKDRKIYLLITLNIFLIITFIVCTIIYSDSRLTPNKVYEKNINSIVEIKAKSDSIANSFGTGVIYSKEGLLITNAHIVTYTLSNDVLVYDSIGIRFINELEYVSVSLVKYDIDIDIAILKVEDDISYDCIKFSNKRYSYGDKVFAVGNTSNYGIGISEGIISVPEVDISYNGTTRKMIQSDINIANGNSGGALLDEKGDLIGLTTFRTKDLSGNINYGFVYSLPLETIKKFIGG